MIPMVGFEHPTKINEKGPTMFCRPLNSKKFWKQKICILLFNHHGFAHATCARNQGIGVYARG